MTSTKAFLISYIKYGDNDAILHCFTEDNGYESFFVRGLYAPKNNKKAYLQPLNELILNIPHKRNGALKVISQIEFSHTNEGFDNDVKVHTMLFFVADFLNQILRNEQQNIEIYKEITLFKNELKQNNYKAHFVFILRLLKIFGLSPLVEFQPFLNPENGNFSTERSHFLFTEEVSQLWKKLLSSENNYTENIPNHLKKDFLECLLVYYHYHFSGFRQPKSLEVLQQIFE